MPPITFPDPHAWDSPQALNEAWRTLNDRADARQRPSEDHHAFGSDPHARCVLLSRALRAGSWRPVPFSGVGLPKKDGTTRRLCIPALEDRVVLSALARWIAEAVEPLLHESSHAYRPGRGTFSALAAVQSALQRGALWALKGDIRDFFDSVTPRLAIDQLKRWGLWENRVARVLRLSLQAEVRGEAGAYCLWRGLAQGSPLSPVLSNITLNALDRAMALEGAAFIRYADDFMLLSPTQAGLDAAQERLTATLHSLALELNEGKTCRAPPTGTLEFLGRIVELQAGWMPTRAGQAGAATDSGHEVLSTSADAQRAVDAAAPNSASEPTPAERTLMPLLRTLYLVSDGTRLSREGDALVVESAGQPRRRLPGARVHQILAFGATTVTSGAIALCLDHGIPVMLSTAHGRRFGLIDPLPEPDLALLEAQLQMSGDPRHGSDIARTLVVAKLRNTLLMLRRWQRHRPREAAASAIQRLSEAVRHAAHAEGLNALRGIEGSAAAAYYGAFTQWLPAHWSFSRRRRRPPPDPVNAMLSYGYTVLYYNTLTIALARGLQPRIGFLHAARAGHHALASDLMEPFRTIVVDAVVMDLACRGRVKPEDFSLPGTPGQPCLMGPAARNTLIHALEDRLNTRLQLRGTDVRLDLRRLIDLQALSLRDRLRGRMPAFEAYVAR